MGAEIEKTLCKLGEDFIQRTVGAGDSTTLRTFLCRYSKSVIYSTAVLLPKFVFCFAGKEKVSLFGC